MRTRVAKSLAVLGFFLTIFVFVRLYQELHTAYENTDLLSQNDYSWMFRLLLNFASYSAILLPLFAIYKYLERTKYFDKIHTQGCMYRVLFTCFGSPGERLPEGGEKTPGVGEVSPGGSPRGEALHLAGCFLGLMGTYLVWGLLQEKIMTQNYILTDGSSVRFTSSSFLVLINRLSGLVLSASYLAYSRQRVSPPLYQFSYCALTNIVSAWCQYEALKYLTFPTQVLSKSCKVVAVMLMGKLVSGNKYESYEYTTAGLITAGMLLFLTGSQQHHTDSSVTLSGVCLLVIYMLSDSFTSNWQAQLFKTVRCSPVQMMCNVSLWSVALTAASLAGPGLRHAALLLQSPALAADCFLLAVSSAAGQLLIYRTVAAFGAHVFTIIMTLRQAVSILLSCVVYGHPVSAGGAGGVLLVLTAVLLRLYCRRRLLSRSV